MPGVYSAEERDERADGNQREADDPPRGAQSAYEAALVRSSIVLRPCYERDVRRACTPVDERVAGPAYPSHGQGKTWTGWAGGHDRERLFVADAAHNWTLVH